MTSSIRRSSPRISTLPVADIELPRQLAGLYHLAYNLWWTWNPPARQLFREVDRESWHRYRNPVQQLINVEPTHWQPLLDSPDFLAAYREVTSAFSAYLEAEEDTWFRRRFPGYDGGPIAYFSMEYGLHQCLAIYSGGLGVLSGDHAKSASDLGLPFVGVGLLYRHGYFRQTIDAEGLQQHTYLEYDFSRLPLRPAAGPTGKEVLVTVPLPGREVAVKVWVAEVGRVPLLLLDTDVPQNDPADRPVSGTLYTAGREMRLIQELVAGVGGVRALRALGIEPGVWHVNEGHCALLQLERLREAVEERGEPAGEALRHLGDGVVFTTHTPVPAGNEQFDRALAGKYLGPWTRGLGLDPLEILELGRDGHGGGGDAFNLTALGLRTSRAANAVSRRNAEVTSRMWGHVLSHREPPIFPVTNGVHTPSWVGPEVRRLFARHLGARWEERLLDGEAWRGVLEVPDEELWTAHRTQKQRLIHFVRSRVREQYARHGRSPDELRRVAGLLDPEALTIGFARRFATYKRADLLFHDLDRLRRLLADGAGPVQVLYAGKAHPADRPGQELIQQIFALSQSPELAGRILFLEDYDMRVGGHMVQGVDVWLNTPRRPLEASGTSGQKAALNGALNVSILDGWWLEGYDGENGWAIEAAPEGTGEDEQDRQEAEALYRLLEEEVAPLFYRRQDGGMPRAWLARMKRAIATVTPRFSSNRMVAEYAHRAYFPDLPGGDAGRILD